VTNFSIAVDSSYKDKSGDKKESVEWVNCIAFDKLGEICNEYLSKSSQIFVSGRMKTEKYQGKDGQDRYTTKIIISDMQMLGGKRQESDQEHATQSQKAPQHTGTGFDDMDDDLIPF